MKKSTFHVDLPLQNETIFSKKTHKKRKKSDSKIELIIRFWTKLERIISAKKLVKISLYNYVLESNLSNDDF